MKMRSVVWDLIQLPYGKRRLGHKHTQKDDCEDAGSRQTFASQGEALKETNPAYTLTSELKLPEL